jgi:hypothetical protein
MQDNPARNKRDYSGRVYRQRTCEDCQEAFTPKSSGQKLCAECRERRNTLPPIRVIPDRACEDCRATFTPQKSVSRRCVPCQDQRNRMMRLESCRRKRAERRGDDVIVRYCADCGIALRRTPGKRCPDCRLARLQHDLERREEREQAAEERRREKPAPRPRRPKPAATPSLKSCADCGTALPDGRRKRCDPCRTAHEQVIRLASNARRRAGYLPRGPRMFWPPTAGLEPRICRVCSEEFRPYRADQLECSRKCRDAHPERMQWKRDSARRSGDRPEVAAAIKQRRRVRSIRGHGLTPAQYDVMLASQGGVCALCGNPPNLQAAKQASKLHIDHDHATGKVRALLCVNCNLGLGRFFDDPAVLREAALYVERFRAVTLT